MIRGQYAPNKEPKEEMRSWTESHLDETGITRVEDVFVGDAVLFDDKPALVFCAHSDIDDEPKMFGQPKFAKYQQWQLHDLGLCLDSEE